MILSWTTRFDTITNVNINSIMSFATFLNSGSDAVETAEREIGIWFEPSELCNWTPSQSSWIYEKVLA